MIPVTELIRRARPLPADSEVGIDEGGLTLLCDSDEDAYLEAGGMIKPEPCSSFCHPDEPCSITGSGDCEIDAKETKPPEAPAGSRPSDTPETDRQATDIIGFYSCATVPAGFARKLEIQRDEAADACAALMHFCEVEMGWMFFRAECAIGDNPTESMKNAKKLREFLKTCPSVYPVKTVPPLSCANRNHG